MIKQYKYKMHVTYEHKLPYLLLNVFNSHSYKSNNIPPNP